MDVFDHFWSFLCLLHENLSQNWDSDGHFEVLGASKSWLDQKLQHKVSQKHFFHALKCIISGLFRRSEFWQLLGNQLSYFQNGYFFKILWWSHEPHNLWICRWKNQVISECFIIKNHEFTFVSFSSSHSLFGLFVYSEL